MNLNSKCIQVKQAFIFFFNPLTPVLAVTGHDEP